MELDHQRLVIGVNWPDSDLSSVPHCPGTNVLRGIRSNRWIHVYSQLGKSSCFDQRSASYISRRADLDYVLAAHSKHGAYRLCQDPARGAGEVRH
jgi:hypothetical protein